MPDSSLVNPNPAMQGTPQSRAAVGFNMPQTPGTPINNNPGGVGAKITPQFIATNPNGTTKPDAPPAPITAISSSDVKDTINNNNTDTKNIITSPQGAYTDPNGIERNADGSEASAPAGATLNPEAGVYTLNGKNYTRETGVQGTAIDQANLATIAGLRTKGDALFAEGMGIIQKQYEDLINTQKDINMRAEAGLGNTLTASGADRYSASSGGIMQGMMSDGLTKISKLVDQENSALLALKTAYQNNDAQLVEKSMTIWKDIKAQQTVETKALMDKLTKANEDIKAQQQKQQDILTTNRNTILQDLGKVGNVPQSVIDGVKNATSVADMITAAGDYLQTSSNADIAGYLFYKRDAQKRGVTPLTPLEYDKYQQDLKNKGAISVAAAQKASDAQDIAKAIIDGTQPPDLSRLYGSAAEVRAILARNGYDLVKASSDWVGLQTWLKNANSSQQLRMRQAESSVKQGLDNLDNLNSQFSRFGLTIGNRAKLEANSQGVGSPLKEPITFTYTKGDGTAGSTTIKTTSELAAAYLTQINLLTDELGQTFMGGNSPTDRAFSLAQASLKGDWNEGMLNAQIATLRQNLQMRENSWSSVGAMSIGGSDNQYAQASYTTKNQENDENAAKQDVINSGQGNTKIQDVVKKMLGDGKSYTEIKALLGI